MSWEPVPYQNVVRVVELFNYALNESNTHLSRYNPVTHEYMGTESETAAFKDTVVRSCAQASFAAWIDIACYPLSAYSSVIIPPAT
jgi:hypothetical protein